MTARSRRPPTGRSAARRRVAGLVAVAAAAGLATGCVGQRDRNDDHVGPHSYRPDDREHTMPGAGRGSGGPTPGSVG